MSIETDYIYINGKSIDVSVAVTPQEQQKGLMFQEWPPPVMVFPYQKESKIKFWMKNTYSPLDIIFCNAGEVIGIFDGEPLSTRLVGPEEPSDFVVEFPRGYAKKLGISNGDKISFFPTEKTLAKQARNLSVFLNR